MPVLRLRFELASDGPKQAQANCALFWLTLDLFEALFGAPLRLLPARQLPQDNAFCLAPANEGQKSFVHLRWPLAGP